MRYTVKVVPPDGSRVREWRFTKRRLAALVLGVGGVVLLPALTAALTLGGVFDRPRGDDGLRVARAVVEGELAVLKAHLDTLYAEDVKLRAMAGLPLYSPDAAQMGFGGMAADTSALGLGDELRRLALRATFESASFAEVERTLSENAELAAATPSVPPVNGLYVSGVGWRTDPITGRRRMHKGVDIAVPIGTPVKATADGRVAFAGWMEGYGLAVRLKHAGGLETLYAHNSSLAVTTGMRVARGTVIAYSGSTGRSVGPHVHYEIRNRKGVLNPLRYIAFGDVDYD